MKNLNHEVKISTIFIFKFPLPSEISWDAQRCTVISLFQGRNDTDWVSPGTKGPSRDETVGFRLPCTHDLECNWNKDFSSPKNIYFSFYFRAWLQVSPPVKLCQGRWDLVIVLTPVTSQTKHLPCFLGMSVTPSSGRFLSFPTHSHGFQAWRVTCGTERKMDGLTDCGAVGMLADVTEAETTTAVTHSSML